MKKRSMHKEEETEPWKEEDDRGRMNGGGQGRRRG